jgi:hypothetical protein
MDEMGEVGEMGDSEAAGDALDDIRKRYQEAEEYWDDNRKAALDDIKFAALDQWPTEIAAQRERDKRPCLTVDKLNQYVRQIVNDGRQNRPSIKVRPVDSGADVETAEVLQGIIKHVEERSNADTAYDCALANAATSGAGYFRILTEYAGDETFDQELCIRRIRNPLSVLIDPAAQEADGSDMQYAFVSELVAKEDFELQWPGKVPADFESNDSYGSWFGDQVRVAEYWCVKEEDRTLYLLTDGRVISKAEYDVMEEEGLADMAGLVKESRNIPKKTVMRAKVSGKDFLEPLVEWPGKWIPLLVVWGNEQDVEGKVVLSGIVRPAKDAQRLYNYSRSAFAERVALTPKSPWVAAEGQVEDYADDWNTANTANHSVLRYRPVSLNGQPVPAPQRTSASDIPSGFAQDMQISEHDIQGAIGMYSSSLGAPSNERSGKAIMARQREGDTGTFHYHDNLNRAIRHAGRILVDLIPRTYDSTRAVRILGYDSKPESVRIDPTMPAASQKLGVQTVYNLGVGTYDVALSTGPSYNTLRQEAAESMAQMVQANPALMGTIGDLLVKNMDWPGADEIAARLKLTLPPQIQEAEKASRDVSPEVQQLQAQFTQQMQQKDQIMAQAAEQLQTLQAEVEKGREANALRRDELGLKAAEVEIKAYAEETKRLSTVSAAMSPEQIQQIVLQTLQDLMTPTLPQEAPQEVPGESVEGTGLANGMPAQMSEPSNMEQQENGY